MANVILRNVASSGNNAGGVHRAWNSSRTGVVHEVLSQLQNHPPSCPCHQNLDFEFFNRQPLEANGEPSRFFRHHPSCTRHKIVSMPNSVAHATRPVDLSALYQQSLPNPRLSAFRSHQYLQHRRERYSTNNNIGAKNETDVDFAFEMATSSVRYGWGVTREIGWDLADLGAKRIAVFTDQNLKELSPVRTVLQSIYDARLERKQSGKVDQVLSEVVIYDRVVCEPTDTSFKDAIEFAKAGNFDAFVAVGGGSVMDTCKAANLYSTYPPEDGDFLAYVNPPIGKGLPVPGPLKPLIAVPTTAGTGSETTGVAIFDLVSMGAKTGIAHRRLKPTLGIIDPENTRTLPPQPAAASGFDVLCHALESYTALPYNKRAPRPPRPLLRPAYQGSNPISDVWSLKALAMVTEFLPRAVEDGANDDEARAAVLLAATFAGIGFGNAGVHLCHAMSYPVSGNVKTWKPTGYKGIDGPLIPHGISVVTHAPSVFRFTAVSDPERHLRAAKIMNASRMGGKASLTQHSDLSRLEVNSSSSEDAGRLLADEVIEMMKRLKVPNGLKEMGFEEKDIPELVEGTLPQHRVTKLSPRPVGSQELSQLFRDSMTIW